MQANNLPVKKVVVIALCSDLYIRNYLSTHAFRELQSSYDIKFLISNQIKDPAPLYELLRDVPFTTYSMNSGRIKRHFKIFDILMWRYRKRSKTFRFRIKRTIGFSKFFDHEHSIFERAAKLSWRALRAFFLRMKNTCLIDSFLFNPYLSYHQFMLGKNNTMEVIIDNLNPDLLIFPSQAYDPEGIDLIKICKQQAIPTLFLIDNWDNLSSKSIFWEAPTKLGVWGEQSIQHAAHIQNIPPDRVTAIGTPRYDNYFALRAKTLISPYNYPYILFVGTALEFDELSVLQEMNQIVCDHPKIFGTTKIIYRPHPWRQGKKKEMPSGLDHVLIDSQLEASFLANDNSLAVQPDLSYYPALLSNAEFVCGGLTSMLIEANIFNQIFLGLVHDDKRHFTSMDNVYSNYEHFQGIDTLSGVLLCNDLANLSNLMLDAMSLKGTLDINKTDAERQFYYFHDDTSYQERLKKLVDAFWV